MQILILIKIYLQTNIGLMEDLTNELIKRINIWIGARIINEWMNE